MTSNIFEQEMKKTILLFFLIISLNGCSNPDEDARKLGFSSHVEMTALQKEGYKTKAEYLKKIDQDKKNEEKRPFEVSLKCYNAFRYSSDKWQEIDSNSPLARYYYNMKKIAEDAIVDEYIKVSKDHSKGVQTYLNLYDSYAPSKLRPDDFDTKEGQVVVAEQRKLLEECKNIIKTDDALKKQKKYLFTTFDEWTNTNSVSTNAVREVTDDRTPDGLTRSQWYQRCQQFQMSINICTSEDRIDRCAEARMGVNEFVMARMYCNGNMPNFSLMGTK